MKKYLLTGVLILLPIALTVFVIIILFDFLTDPFLAVTKLVLESTNSQLVHYPETLTFIARFITLIFLFIFTLILGFFARSLFMNKMVASINFLFSKMPLIKNVHKISQDVFSSIISEEDRKAFNTPVIVPFPSSKTFVVGFKTGKIPKICQEKSSDILTPVFVPTIHLITGCLILVPEKDIKEVNMSNEMAVKFTISCGIVTGEEVNGS